MAFDLTPKTFFQFSKVILAGTILGLAFMLVNISFFEIQDNFSSSVEDRQTSALGATSLLTSDTKPTNESIASLSDKPSLMNLAALPVTYRIPDLRALVLYHGTNRRPDAPSSTALVTFSLRTDPSRVISVGSGVKIPLSFEIRQGSGKWVVPSSFQPNSNKDLSPTTTPLTLTITPGDNSATIKVDFTPPQGQQAVVESTYEATFFTVPLSPLPMAQAEIQKWKLGEYTVDPTLLERQKIVWYGQDNVINTLGDDEWDYQKSRQRVQFGSDEDAYVIWAEEGDCFIFDEDMWIPQTPGPATVGKALLVVTSVQDKAIIWTLWNEDGTIHFPLQTLRKDPGAIQEKDKKAVDIKIVGAKSKMRWIMEINGQRLIVQPNDWLILDEREKKAIIIDSPTLLSDYLEGRVSGSLLAFQKVEKRGTDQFLLGTLFDPTRAQAQSIEVSLYRSWEKANAPKNNPASKKASSKDEDDDEDDDFFIDDESDLDDTKNAGPDDDLFQDDFDDE